MNKSERKEKGFRISVKITDDHNPIYSIKEYKLKEGIWALFDFIGHKIGYDVITEVIIDKFFGVKR